MKKIIGSILLALTLTGCANKYTLSDNQEVSICPSISQSSIDPTATTTKPHTPNTVTIYYFQIYVDQNLVQGNDNVDYCFELNYPYGTNLIQYGLPSSTCRQFRPKEQFTEMNLKQYYFTNLDPLLYEEDKLTSLDHDRVVYFANAK